MPVNRNSQKKNLAFSFHLTCPEHSIHEVQQEHVNMCLYTFCLVDHSRLKTAKMPHKIILD